MLLGLVLYLFVSCLADDHFVCDAPLEVTTFPFSQTVTCGGSAPGVCGEDALDSPAFWFKLSNTNPTELSLQISVDGSAALHRSCETECLNALPSTSFLTIPAHDSYLLVVKSASTATVTITAIADSSAVIDELPFATTLVASPLKTPCVDGTANGVSLDLKTAPLSRQISTCGSAVAVTPYLVRDETCEDLAYTRCPNDQGVIVTVPDAAQKVHLIAQDDGIATDKIVSVAVTYVSGPSCSAAPVFDTSISGTIYANTPNTPDGCSQTSLPNAFVAVQGTVKTTFTLTADDDVSIHVLPSCSNLDQCIERIQTVNKVATFALDLKQMPSQVLSVVAQSNTDVHFTLAIPTPESSSSEPTPTPSSDTPVPPSPQSSSETPVAPSSDVPVTPSSTAPADEGLSTGMIVFICIFAALALVVILIGIGVLTFVIVRKTCLRPKTADYAPVE